MKNSEESIAGNTNKAGKIFQQMSKCNHREILARGKESWVHIATLRCENLLHLWSPTGNNNDKLDLSFHKHSLGTCGLERRSTTTNSMKCSLIALQTSLAKT